MVRPWQPIAEVASFEKLKKKMFATPDRRGA